MFERENAPRILTDEQLDTIHDQAVRTLEEIGTDVLHEGARKVLEAHGQAVDGERVRWDREFVDGDAGEGARSSFSLRGRNPERVRHDRRGAAGADDRRRARPFCADLERGRRERPLAGPRRAGEAGPRRRPAHLPPERHGRGERPATSPPGTWTWTTRSSAGPTSRSSATAPPAPRRATRWSWPRSRAAAGRRSRRRPRSWASSIRTARSSGTASWWTRSRRGRRRTSRSS